MEFWNSFWGIFIIVAGGAVTISGFIAAVVAIVQYVKTGTNFIRNFLNTHGTRGRMNALADKVDKLVDVVESNTEALKGIQAELDANTRLTLKLELKSLYRNHPEEILVIKKTWQKYHDLHGDSYIDDMHEEWKEQYEKPYLQKTLKKGAK